MSPHPPCHFLNIEERVYSHAERWWLLRGLLESVAYDLLLLAMQPTKWQTTSPIPLASNAIRIFWRRKQQMPHESLGFLTDSTQPAVWKQLFTKRSRWSLRERWPLPGGGGNPNDLESLTGSPHPLAKEGRGKRSKKLLAGFGWVGTSVIHSCSCCCFAHCVCI
jgi:hypothetical protein